MLRILVVHDGDVAARGGPISNSASATARLEIRELVDAYAQGVDRKDVVGVASLFTSDGRLVSTFGPGTVVDPVVHTGRDSLEKVLEAGLARYQSTTHVIASHTSTVEGDSGRGETRCLAHHAYRRQEESRLLVLAVRYEDLYRIEDDAWRFAQRELYVDWRDDKVLSG